MMGRYAREPQGLGDAIGLLDGRLVYAKANLRVVEVLVDLGAGKVVERDPALCLDDA